MKVGLALLAFAIAIPTLLKIAVSVTAHFEKPHSRGGRQAKE